MCAARSSLAHPFLISGPSRSQSPLSPSLALLPDPSPTLAWDTPLTATHAQSRPLLLPTLLLPLFSQQLARCHRRALSLFNPPLPRSRADLETPLSSPPPSRPASPPLHGAWSTSTPPKPSSPFAPTQFNSSKATGSEESTPASSHLASIETAFTTPDSAKSPASHDALFTRVGEASVKPPRGFEYLEKSFQLETGQGARTLCAQSLASRSRPCADCSRLSSLAVSGRHSSRPRLQTEPWSLPVYATHAAWARPRRRTTSAPAAKASRAASTTCAPAPCSTSRRSELTWLVHRDAGTCTLASRRARAWSPRTGCSTLGQRSPVAMRFSPARSSSRTTTILASCPSLALLTDDSRALTPRKCRYDAPADLREARLKAAAHLSLLTGKKGKGE